jgi:hypothetical protein
LTSSIEAAAGKTHTFDSFECAIHKLAPTWSCATAREAAAIPGG